MPSRARRFSVGRLDEYQATPPSATSATSSSTTLLNGKSTSLSIPNAAPVLWTRVRLSQPGTRSTLSCKAKRDRTSALVSWSAMTIATTVTSSRRRIALFPLQTHRFGQSLDAAWAQPRAIGGRADLGHDAPAPIAAHAGGPGDGHRQRLAPAQAHRRDAEQRRQEGLVTMQQ